MSKVKKYMKNPIAVEVLQLTWENWGEMCEFAEVPKKATGLIARKEEISMQIETFEGKMIANEGDYIIKGILGELYPCRKDIFEKTYTDITYLYNDKPDRKTYHAKPERENKEISAK